MEQSPWEANSHSASQEILRLLWNRNVHYSVHKSPPLFPNLSQMSPVHTFPLCFPKIHSNITLPSTTGSFKLYPPFRFSDQNFVRISSLPCVLYASPISFSLIWYRFQVMKLLFYSLPPLPTYARVRIKPLSIFLLLVSLFFTALYFHETNFLNRFRCVSSNCLPSAMLNEKDKIKIIRTCFHTLFS
jgi:hypothetical protein